MSIDNNLEQTVRSENQFIENDGDQSEGNVMGLLEWLFGEHIKMGVYAIVNLIDGKQYAGLSAP